MIESGIAVILNGFGKMILKNKILDLLKDKSPKVYVHILKSKPDLLEELKQSYPGLPIIEALYCCINNTTPPVCELGNKRKFNSITKGYVFCGKPNSCGCAKKQISEKVSNTKNNYSEEKRHNINEKRKKTNLKKYGVSNIGQTEKAKKAHIEFYSKKSNIKIALEKYKQTCLDKYGVTNPKKNPIIAEKMKETFIERYGVNNPAKIPSVKEKLKIRQQSLKENRVLLEHGYLRIKNQFEENNNLLLLTPFSDYMGTTSKDKLEFKCLQCNNTFFQSYINKPKCKICNPTQYKFQSKEENELYNFLSNDLNLHCIQSDRCLINPYELDIVIPQLKLAIEYCGLYWHSELSGKKDKKYHKQKLNLANSKGYSLITIFSDEWCLKKDTIKLLLKHKLFKNTLKIPARKLQIVELKWKECKPLLNEWHMQGAGSATPINLALTDGNTIFCIMTFSTLRKALMQDKINNYYELVRFATNGYNIQGGASKLLNYFVKKYNPINIDSYCDLRWSEGNLYKKLGFNKEKDGVPGYWYSSDYISKHHRYNFRKQILVKNNPEFINLTEWEIMQLLGYDRIWDCGHSKWVWKK